jgi:hypothetical protein
VYRAAVLKTDNNELKNDRLARSGENAIFQHWTPMKSCRISRPVSNRLFLNGFEGSGGTVLSRGLSGW